MLLFIVQVFGQPLTRDKYRPSATKAGDYDQASVEDDKLHREVFKVKNSFQNEGSNMTGFLVYWVTLNYHR